MRDLLLIKDTNYWNKAEGVEVFNDFLTKLDKEDTNIEMASFINSKGTWTNDLEYIKNTFIRDPKELTKNNLLGSGTFITDSFSFCGKNVISLMKDGYVLVINHEIQDLLTFLESRYNDLSNYELSTKKIGDQEEKIKAFKSTKKEFEDVEEYKVKLGKLEAKLQDLKDVRKISKDNLSMSGFSFKFLNFESTYLLKNSSMIYCNKAAGVAFFKLNKANTNFNYKEFDELTRVANQFKEERVKDFKKKLKSFFKEEVVEAEEAETKETTMEENRELKCLIKTFNNFEFKLKIPLFSQDMAIVLTEPVMEIDIKRTISMSGSIPMAPVKASIAAAMLASGVGGKLDKSVIKDNEINLIKTAIAPIQHTETVSINGMEEVQKTFSWEPQLGKFNKLRKEFVILR